MTTQSVAKTDGAVVELVSFTPQELDIIIDALNIAGEHYRMLAALWVTSRGEFREQFEQQAHEAGELQLKIEAAR